MNKSLRLGAILLFITGLTGLILGIAYKVTEEPIARSRMRQKMEALRNVLPQGETFQEITSPEALKEGFLEIHEGYEGDFLVGYALTLPAKGYAGDILLMIGVSPEGSVLGVRVLAHQETPGLGARGAELAFLEQFQGKNRAPLKVVKPPSQEEGIQAITGATITTRGIARGVDKAFIFVKEHFPEGEEE